MAATLNCLLPSDEWDSPIFKVLAHNDTGAAKGKVSGLVIPKDLRPYFPWLAGNASALDPTEDRRIEAELFIGNTYKQTVNARYQYQTWGGTRSAESRLTDQLGTLRNEAIGGDILVIQRNMARLDCYRLTLVKQSSDQFAIAKTLTGERKWGVLLLNNMPVSDSDLKLAQEKEQAIELSPFQLIDPLAEVVTSSTSHVARSIVFRTTVLKLYEKTCAVCAEALATPSGAVETDAAHIVPRSQMGADDARNGIALCKQHHWAFDKGLFGVTDDRSIIVPEAVSSIAQNLRLKQLDGHAIREAADPRFSVHPDAFRWHRDHILKS
jgi:putative restriction endonuclease